MREVEEYRSKRPRCCKKAPADAGALLGASVTGQRDLPEDDELSEDIEPPVEPAVEPLVEPVIVLPEPELVLPYVSVDEVPVEPELDPEAAEEPDPEEPEPDPTRRLF